jgi:E3 ubiquitin-protein ligase SIAH1
MAADEFFAANLENAWCIINVLECPVCMDIMRAPILQCKNGHNICSVCKLKLRNCPTCRAEFIEARSLALEKLSQILRFPCANSKIGCTEKLPIHNIMKHNISCPYRIHKCLLGLPGSCSWEGRRTDILQHAKEKHEVYAFDSRVDRFSEYEDWKETMEGAVLCTMSEEIFLLRKKRDSNKRKYYEAVQYIGPAENASKYRYKHHLVSPGGHKEMTVECIVRSDTESMEQIIETGECFIMDYDMAKTFIGREGRIGWTVTISTQSDN